MSTLHRPTPSIAAQLGAAFQQFVGALADLARFGYGTSTFTVNDAGELEHAGTVITLKIEKGESLESFHARIRGQVQKGDTIEIVSTAGRLDTARLTLQPRH